MRAPWLTGSSSGFRARPKSRRPGSWSMRAAPPPALPRADRCRSPPRARPGGTSSCWCRARTSCWRNRSCPRPRPAPSCSSSCPTRSRSSSPRTSRSCISPSAAARAIRPGCPSRSWPASSWTSGPPLLKSNGLEPEALYADSELLPQNPGQAVALLEEDSVVVRPPAGTVVTLPADALGRGARDRPLGHRAGHAGRAGASSSTPARRSGTATPPTVEAARAALRGHPDSAAHGRPARPLRAAAARRPRPPTSCRAPTRRPRRIRWAGARGGWRPCCSRASSPCTSPARPPSSPCSSTPTTARRLDRAGLSDGDAGRARHLRGAAPDGAAPRRRCARATASGGFLLALQALVQAHQAAPEAVLEALTFRDGALELKASAPSVESLDQAQPPAAPAGLAGAPGRRQSGRLRLRGPHPDVAREPDMARALELPSSLRSLSPRDRRMLLVGGVDRRDPLRARSHPAARSQRLASAAAA